jgi:toxin ParE1/3/4
MPKTISSPGKSVPRYKYARTADRDLEGILQYTAGRFGPLQRRRYAELIDRAASMIAADPIRTDSRPRNDMAPGVRSFHVELATRRRGAAAHILYYVEGMLDDGREGVIILRVLHERMDPTRYLGEDC